MHIWLADDENVVFEPKSDEAITMADKNNSRNKITRGRVRNK